MGATIDEHLPFGRVLLPWTTAAFASLPASSLLTDSARSSLRFALVERMAAVLAPALLPEFQAQSVGYDQFTTAFADRQRLQEVLPVGCALLELMALQWSDATRDLVDRLHQDFEPLQQILAPGGQPVQIERVAAFLGDPHRGGRSVVRLTTDADISVFYKPRSVTQERRFFELNAQLQASFGDRAIPTHVIEGDGYGWLSEVRSAPVVDSSSYWQAAGRTTALAYLAGATDLHNENVIATLAGPLPIDLECADQPLVWATDHDVQDPDPQLHMTVMSTGLLPNYYREATAVAIELCGLLAKPNQSGGSWRNEWIGLGTDAIGLTRRLSSWGSPDNRPRDSSGRIVPADVDALVRGFDEARASLTRAGSPIDDWEPLTSRVLFRETMEYVTHLATITAPDALADTAVFDDRVQRLPPLSPGAVSSLGPATVEALEHAERAAMSQLDVPLHHAFGDSLILDDGTVITNGVLATASSRLEERRTMSQGAMGAAQSTLVRVVCEQHEKVDVPLDHRPLPSVRTQDLTAAAIAIGEDLRAQNVAGPTSARWLTLTGAPPRRSGTFADVSLYSGRSGIGIFFASLAALTQQSSWADLAERCMVSRTDAPPWFDIGTAGAAYARAVVGTLLGDDDQVRQARNDLLAIDQLPEALDELDMINGWGGVIGVHLALLEVTHDPVIEQRTQQLVTSYVEILESQLASAIDGPGRAKPGHAHGISGIAALLDRSGHLLDTPAFTERAHDLWELDLARAEQRNHLAGRLIGRDQETAATTTWCWGGSGVLHALASSTLDPAVFEPVLTATLPALLDHRPDHHHLCCGEAGRALCLHRVGATFGRTDVAEHAQRLAASLAERVINGHPLRTYNDTSVVDPGLFFGRAGIGYALCRLAAPSLIPDVLAIEVTARVQ